MADKFNQRADPPIPADWLNDVDWVVREGLGMPRSPAQALANLGGQVRCPGDGLTYVGLNGSWAKRGVVRRVEEWGASLSASNNYVPFQQAIDELSAAGGGLLLAGPGEWDLGGLLRIRDGVTLCGDSAGTVLVNEYTGVNSTDSHCLTFGTYRASGTSPTMLECVQQYAAEDATAGAWTVTVTDNGGEFTAGDIVLLFSDGDPDSFAHYQQINRVESVLGDVLTLRYPLYKDFDSSPTVALTGTGAELGLGSDGEIPAKVAFRAGLANLSLYSEYASGITLGGALECAIDNVTLIRSTRILSGNGFAHSVARGMRGAFRTQAFNLAYFSHNSLVSGSAVGCAGTDGVDSDAAILIEENAHHLRYSNLTIDIGAAENIAYGIRFSKSAEFNAVDGVTLVSGRTTFHPIFTTWSTTGPREGNSIRGLIVNAPASNGSFYSDNSSTDTDRRLRAPTVIENCLVDMDQSDTTNFAIKLLTPDTIIRNCLLPRLNIRLEANSSGGIISDCHTPGDVLSISDVSAGDHVLRRLTTPLRAQTANSDVVFCLAEMSSETANNVLAEAVYAAGSFTTEDWFDVDLRADVDGTGSTKVFEIHAIHSGGTDTTLATLTVPTGNNNRIILNGHIQIRSVAGAARSAIEISLLTGTATRTLSVIAATFAAANSLTLQIQGWVTGAGGGSFLASGFIRSHMAYRD